MLNDKQVLAAFMTTLLAIVILVAMGAAISISGHSVEAIGIGAAVTGLIAVATTFRTGRVPLPEVDPNMPAGPFVSKLKDYAEVIKRAPGCLPLGSGAVCGVNVNGELVSKHNEAHSFVVVSTHAGFVGGVDASIDFQACEVVALVGQVPVNVTGGTPGYFIEAIEGPMNTITGTTSALAGPNTLGRIWRIEQDGRAWVKLL